MKNKIKSLGMVLLLSLLAHCSIFAYDIESDGIYYNINVSDKTVSVTNNGENSYSGDIIIPLSVIYNNRELPVTSIESYAFKGCSRLMSVEIPNSVTYIGSYAFKGCSRLASVEIPNSVTTIGSNAFNGCTMFVSVEIPNSVTTIGSSAFEGCSRLVSVEIPNSVTTIETGVFEGCSKLASVEIPNSVTSIGAGAFKGCSSLASVEIPNSVTYIESFAFEKCSSLASVEIPNSVTYIGTSAFSGCSSLASVEIPNSVTTMGDYAFKGCSSLASVEIPNSVTYIGKSAFKGCSSLKSVRFQDGIAEIQFYYDEETWEKYNSFEDCYIEHLHIGRNYVGKPFVLQTYFKTISLGKDVTIVSDIRFIENNYLESLTCYPTVPPKISAFSNLQYTTIKVYVPYGTLEAYQNAEYWNNFWNIEEMEPFTNENAVENIIDKEGEVSIYSISGILLQENVPSKKIDELDSGLYVIKSKNSSLKIKK